MAIRFVMNDSATSAAKAAGVDPRGVVIPACPISVGDVMSFPDSPHLFFRVAQRVLVAQRPPGQSEWLLMLQPAKDPMLHDSA